MKSNIKHLDMTFVESAAEYSQCLVHNEPEIAFVGASNAGKSSAINAISNQKKLAKTSKTPGKTKLFNFFKLSHGYIVDFPGYGYSKVSKKQKKEWSKELPKYFDHRKNLIASILFTDIRNPMREMDLSMLNFAYSKGVPTLLVLTKSDKVSTAEAEAISDHIQKNYGENLIFSIQEKASIQKLSSFINELLSS
tara:strand:- start:12899 stop:13480 length:582 start_codon:yes stop_codon:yes gene_type:complete